MFFFKHSSNVSDSICLPTISLALAVMIVGLTIKVGGQAEVSASSVGPDCKVAPNLQDGKLLELPPLSFPIQVL